MPRYVPGLLLVLLSLAWAAGLDAAGVTGYGAFPLPDPANSTVYAVTRADSPVRLDGRTGVEMEALVAASVAALTVYDMCKAVDRGLRSTDIRLRAKSGGKSGHYEAD